MRRLTKGEREFFTRIADSLIAVGRPGGTGYRRSLGAHRTCDGAMETGALFLRFVKRNFPGSRFGLSGIEGTGGTENFRIRAYLVR